MSNPYQPGKPYQRVIPRDLFNEAKLLKCLGRLYIEGEKGAGVEMTDSNEGTRRGFEIVQDEGSGDIFAANIEVRVAGCRVHVYTTLNAREPWPMWCDYRDETVPVFDEAGELTAEFLTVTSAVLA